MRTKVEIHTGKTKTEVCLSSALCWKWQPSLSGTWLWSTQQWSSKWKSTCKQFSTPKKSSPFSEVGYPVLFSHFQWHQKRSILNHNETFQKNNLSKARYICWICTPVPGAPIVVIKENFVSRHKYCLSLKKNI